MLSIMTEVMLIVYMSIRSNYQTVYLQGMHFIVNKSFISKTDYFLIPGHVCG